MNMPTANGRMPTVSQSGVTPFTCASVHEDTLRLREAVVLPESAVALGLVAYLTTAGTAPWVVGAIAVGLLALAARAKSGGRSSELLTLAVLAFVFAGLAILALAASKACE